VKFVDQMPSSASTGTANMLFGDLSSCIASGSNGQVYIDSNEGVYFANDLTALRVIEHYGQIVYQPGTNGTLAGMVNIQFSSAS
jgi:HK97 family phage major capsid protein